MQNLPIDIHLTKLLDWILDRRHCPRDWQKNVLVIRNKINLAIQDMPEHEDITSLLSGSIIHYFNCLRIVDILKETEKNSKNIFGMYSSQRMKDWNSVVSSYQKNSIYLAEAASILQRNVAYEIPALKKSVQKCQHSQTECDEKHLNLNKTISEINLQIKQLCTELGIVGVDIAAELKSLPQQLDSVLEAIVKKCGTLERVIQFYMNYAEYFLNRKTSDCLPLLGYLAKKGNTTVYEWRTGSSPAKIEKAVETLYSFGEEREVNDDIDFGMESMGDTANEDQGGGGEIDWGDLGSSEAPEELIDYNIDIDALSLEISVEGAGIYIPTDGIAKGNDALTLLEFNETRNLMLNEILKLETFLRQKYNEMISESDNLILSVIYQDAPKSIQAITEKDLKVFMEQLKDLSGYFKVKRVEQLFHVNDSPKYLKRLYEQFEMKWKSIERCHKQQQRLKDKLVELNREETDMNEKLKLIVAKTKELQKYICEDMSKKYNGVRINIMGEINMI